MRIGDVLYFSPRYRFSDLDFEKPEIIAKGFQDRVEGFYFIAAKRLIEERHAFAAGLVVCAGVEFVATAWDGQEPAEWLHLNVAAFRNDPSLAKRFWDRFRHGLTHEGRIRSFGQFSFDIAAIMSEEGHVLIVNPALLLKAVEEAFRNQCETMTTNRSAVIAGNLQRYFAAEVRAAQD
jgi:hypothetical protein